MRKRCLLPLCYRLKIAICNLINPLKGIELNAWVRGKKVINIGYGFINYIYDERLTAINIGIDKAFNVVSYAVYKKGVSKSKFIVADAEHIPFKDRAFDTSVASFIVHHISLDHKLVLDEIRRVTKDYIVIIDHVLSRNKIKALIQKSYWTIFDRGTQYNTEKEWNCLLNNYKVVYHTRLGRLFKNICEYVLKLSDEYQMKP